MIIMVSYQNREFTDVCRESESGPGNRQGGAALYDVLRSVFQSSCTVLLRRYRLMESSPFIIINMHGNNLGSICLLSW